MALYGQSLNFLRPLLWLRFFHGDHWWKPKCLFRGLGIDVSVNFGFEATDVAAISKGGGLV